MACAQPRELSGAQGRCEGQSQGSPFCCRVLLEMLPRLRAFGNSLSGFDPALVLVCVLWCTLLSQCALRLDARGSRYGCGMLSNSSRGQRQGASRELRERVLCGGLLSLPQPVGSRGQSLV